MSDVIVSDVIVRSDIVSGAVVSDVIVSDAKMDDFKNKKISIKKILIKKLSFKNKINDFFRRKNGAVNVALNPTIIIVVSILGIALLIYIFATKVIPILRP